jgi:recombination protein RecT
MVENNKQLASKIAQKNEGTGLTIPVLITNWEKSIVPKLAKGADQKFAERLFWALIDAARRQPKIFDCSQVSVLNALVHCKDMGLVPGAMQEAALIPYGTELTFQPMYQGLVKLAYQSGLIKRIAAEVVYSNDYFDYCLGTEEYLKHRISTEAERGEFVCAYAIIELTQGGRIIRVMSAKEILSIRDKSANHRSAKKYNKASVWDEYFDAQARKTVLKQALKVAPKTSKLQMLIDSDNTIERPDLNQKLAVNFDIDTQPADQTSLTDAEKAEVIEVENAQD